MVFSFRRASRPTSIKLTPSPAFCFSGACSDARTSAGRASLRTPSSGSTSADRLRDLRNQRREENKRVDTFPSLDRVTIRRYFYSERLLALASLDEVPTACSEDANFSFSSAAQTSITCSPGLATAVPDISAPGQLARA